MHLRIDTNMTANPFTVMPVIMAGGSGTRLWPLSRAGCPKQFLVLSGTRSLFQSAAQRLTSLADGAIDIEPAVVVANEDHRFLVAEQLREIGLADAVALLEPVARNTAAAMTLAALYATQGDADPVLVVSPADHLVADGQAFATAIGEAAHLAAAGCMVTLGVTPTRAETGFGYIRVAAAPAPGAGMPVLHFAEKPDDATAQRYLDGGDYFWNSGIFVVRASVWLAMLNRYRPDIAQATRSAWDQQTTDGRFIRPGKAEFAAIPAESVDYAVMEKAANEGAGVALRMVPLAAGWSDLGAWDTVWAVSEKDAAGNVSHGDVVLRDSRNTLVHATARLVGAIGLDNLLIVETADAVLVSSRDRSQDVKHLVGELAQRDRSEHLVHREVHRPWGRYVNIDAGARFQVKRILVNPGASLSLQLHHHRAEHWIVVRGTAEVTCGDKTLLLTENQSTYIPLGEVHKLANPGKVPLEVIEVQSGAYLGEDDIVRFGDSYGRS